MDNRIRISNFPLENITYKIIGIAIEIHNCLGIGFSEIVYKDAIEFEFVKNNVRYIREKEFAVQYKGTVLKHKYFADFVVEDNIILEIKSKGLFADEDFAQTINYLKCSGCKVGIVLNFGSKKIGIKRIVN